MAIRNRVTQLQTYLVKQIQCSRGGILLGRSSGAGDAQEIIIGSGLTLTGTTLSAAGTVTWDTLSGKPLTFAPTAHTHVSASVTDAVSNATEEGSTGKLLKTDEAGTVTVSEFFSGEMTTDFLTIIGGNNPAQINNSNAVNGLSFSLATTAGTLAVTPRIDGAVSYNDLVDVPATIPLTASKSVANAAARLALTAEQAEGFAVVDADTGKTWMLVAGGTPSVSGDWLQLGDRDITAADITDASASGQAVLTGTPAQGRTAIGAAPIIDVTAAPYNAVGDGMRVDVVSITSGAAVLTCPSAAWTANHVGKYIRVEGAGAAGADLVTTIASRQSNTQVTLAANASTTVATAGSAFFGTNDTDAIQAALDAAAASAETRDVYAPPGVYLGNWIIPQNVRFFGAYRGTITNDLETPAQLANRELFPTVLLPAVTTSPVVFGDDTTGMVTGSTVQGFVVSGSAAKAGHGIRLGDILGGTGFSSGNARVLNCLVSGFALGIGNSNAVDGEVGHCVVNDCTVGYLINRHDGCFMHNVSTTGCATPFIVYGCKNLRVQTGNLNYMDTCFDITDSHVSVGTINVEYPTNEIVALRQVGGTASFTADFIQVLSAGEVISVRDYFPEASRTQVSVNIKQIHGGTEIFFDTANRGYPVCIKGVSFIRRYVDNTFAVLNRMEKVRRVYLTPWEAEESVRTIKDEFAVRGLSSAWGDLGWIYSAIGGSYATPAAHESGAVPGTFLIASTGATGADAVRFWPSSTIMPPLNGFYWKMQWILRVQHTATATFRAGVYSTDVALKPLNGLGFRIDTSLGDTTIKLEILNAGTPAVVDTGIAISSLQTTRRIVMQRTNKGVSLALFEADGITQLGPEVLYSAALPSWTGYHRASVLTGVNSAVAQTIGLNQFLYTQYLGSEF